VNRALRGASSGEEIQVVSILEAFRIPVIGAGSFRAQPGRGLTGFFGARAIPKSISTVAGNVR
jgi:hypothetical protein